MATAEELLALCRDEGGGLKTVNEARAAMINHLILEEMVDIDDAEDLADKTIRESGLWE